MCPVDVRLIGEVMANHKGVGNKKYRNYLDYDFIIYIISNENDLNFGVA